MNPSKILCSVRTTFTTSTTFERGFNFRFIFETFIFMTSISSQKVERLPFFRSPYLHSNASSSSRHLLTLSCAIHHREQEKKKKTAIDFFPHRTNSQFCLYGKLWWSQRWFLVVVVDAGIVVSRRAPLFLHCCCAPTFIVHYLHTFLPLMLHRTNNNQTRLSKFAILV